MNPMTEENLEELALLQAALAQKVIIPDAANDLQLETGDAIFSLDVQYVGDTRLVAIDHAAWRGNAVEIYAVNATGYRTLHPWVFCIPRRPQCSSPPSKRPSTTRDLRPN